MSLIDEAFEALAHLGAARLEELGQRAGLLQSLMPGAAGFGGSTTLPLFAQKFRLFTALLEATGNNLTTLRRAEAQEEYGAGRFGRQSFGPGEALSLHTSRGSWKTLEGRRLLDEGESQFAGWGTGTAECLQPQARYGSQQTIASRDYEGRV